MTYSNFGGVSIPADIPHFLIYQNVSPNPRENFVSLNSPVLNEAAAGPNGRNTLDRNAPGAVAGLDPREAVAWSTDGGVSWGWGRQVGAGSVPGDYSGSGDDGVRLPWYAWQEQNGAPLQSNQPYYASGRNQPISAMVSMYMVMARMPGMMPAMNSLPMSCSVMMP